MGTRDEYVASMKSAFVSIATKLTQAWAASLIPWLASVFFQKIIGAIAEKLFTYLATQSELQIFFMYIDTRVGQQSKAFEDAAMKYHQAQQGTDQNAIQIAEQELEVAFANFIKLSA